MTEIHIHLHSDRERAALGQIDENLDDPDVGEAALVAPIDAPASTSGAMGNLSQIHVRHEPAPWQAAI